VCGTEQSGEGVERREDGECSGEEKLWGTSQTKGRERIRPVTWLAHGNLWAWSERWAAAVGLGQAGTRSRGGRRDCVQAARSGCGERAVALGTGAARTGRSHVSVGSWLSGPGPANPFP
jgi:hypothetical protein